MGISQILMIDNFDSFTYNLADELAVLGCKLTVLRNDVPVQTVADTLKALSRKGQTALVLSPGPSTPSDAGNLLAIIQDNLGRFPQLGICLGHQAIAQALGGTVARAPEICHGKSSPLEDISGPLLEHVTAPVQAARYHSLVVTKLPRQLTAAASVHGLCMAFYSTRLRVAGLQFHPESVLTTQGRQILRSCLGFLGA